MSATFRPATRADFRAFYGDSIPGQSARAWVAEIDGEILGIGGVYYDRGRAIAFSEFREGLDRKDMVRGARRIMDIVRGVHGPVYAIPGGFDTAPGVLAHYGFEPVGGVFMLREGK